MKGMSKRLIEWLWKAVNNKDDNMSIFSIQDNSAISSDGKRMHAINSIELPDIVNGVNITSALSDFDNASIQASFLINPKFLREALLGFDKIVEITLVDNGDEFQAIVIKSSRSENEAYIMCMKREDENG